LLPGV